MHAAILLQSVSLQLTTKPGTGTGTAAPGTVFRYVFMTCSCILLKSPKPRLSSNVPVSHSTRCNISPYWRKCKDRLGSVSFSLNGSGLHFERIHIYKLSTIKLTLNTFRAVTRFPSGGGFSNIYPIPSYQASAVNTYLTQHKPPYASYQTSDLANIGANGGIYNSAGRGYPDFSAVGDNVVIFNAGAPTLIGGTSAAAPVFAAILTRINEERLSAGKSRIGFVNPTLYAHPGS